VFPEDDPYLDQDTVFGVRDDLVIQYQTMAPGTFPDDGFSLSGKVEGNWLQVDFDVVLVRDTGTRR